MKFAKTASVIVTFLFVVISATFAGSEAPSEFRTIKWGSKPASGMKRLTGPTSDGTSLYAPSSGKKSLSLYDVPVAEEAYSYTHGKFYSGSAWLDGQPNLEKMKVALTKQFGPPSFANEQAKIWRWKWPVSRIEVTLHYQQKFARTTVTFLNNGI